MPAAEELGQPLDIDRPVTPEDIERLARQLIGRCPKQVSAYQAGATGILGFFVAQVMVQTRGTADPQVVSETFTRLLPSLI